MYPLLQGNYTHFVLDFETRGLMGDFLCVSITRLNDRKTQQMTMLNDFKAWYMRMMQYKITFWAHNVSYEIEYIRKLGLPTDCFKWACSQVLAHCVNKENKSDKTSLEYLSVTYGGVPKMEFTPLNGWESMTPTQPDWQEMLRYNRTDTEATADLIIKLLESVGTNLKLAPSKKAKYINRMQEKLAAYFWDIRMPFLLEVLIPAKRHGLTMSQSMVEEIISDCDAQLKSLPLYALPTLVKGEVETKTATATVANIRHYMSHDGTVKTSSKVITPERTIKRKTGIIELVPEKVAYKVYERCDLHWRALDSSTDKAVAWLLKQNGLSDYINDSGNVDVKKIDVNTKERYLSDLVYGSTLNTIRGYMVSYLKAANWLDGNEYFTVHSFLDINGTQTGRLSSSNPNIQNISGSKSIANPIIQAVYSKIRRIVTARPGYRFLSADLDRIELTILSKYLEPFDTGLRDVLNKNEDVHQYNADKWGLDRLTAKRLIFSLIYGAREHKVSEIMSCTLPKAKRVIEQIFEGMPALAKAIAQVEQQCIELGGIYDRFGDFKTYPAIYSSNKWEVERCKRQLFNAAMQGTNASLIAWLTPQVTRLLCKYNAFLVSIVHDEMLVEVPTDADVEALMTELHVITGNRYDIPGLEGCRVNADWKAGGNWYETK